MGSELIGEEEEGEIKAIHVLLLEQEAAVGDQSEGLSVGFF